MFHLPDQLDDMMIADHGRLFGLTPFAWLLPIAVLTVTPAVPAADPFSLPGPYAVGSRTVTVDRTDGSSFEMLLYHPADSAGANVPLAAGSQPFPAISFGPGFLQTNSQYASTLRHLASWGYLVGSTESQFGFAPDKPQYAQDLSDMLTALELANADPGSDFAGRVATDRFGVAGHSLGGGVSVLTAVADPRIKAVANFAAASTNSPPPFPPGLPPTDDPSAIDLASNLTIPVSFISGSQDSIITVVDNGQLMFNNAPAPKLLPNIVGGFHCGFTDNDTAFFCDSGSITGAEQRALARAELTSFFETYLGENDQAWKRVWGPDRQALTGVVDSLLDPGFMLVASDPLVTIDPQFGGEVAFTLTNISLAAQTFDLFAEGPWSALLSVQSTPVLAPSESFQFHLMIEFPGPPLGAREPLLVSARSGLDGGTRAFTLIEAVAVPEPGGWIALLGMAAAVGGRRVRRRCSSPDAGRNLRCS